MSEEFTPKFRKGDRLVCVEGSESYGDLVEGSEYSAAQDSHPFHGDPDNQVVLIALHSGRTIGSWAVDRFKLAEPEQPKEKQVTITLDESVAREFLEDVPQALHFVEEAIKQALPTREVRHIHCKCAYCDSALIVVFFKTKEDSLLLRCPALPCRAEWTLLGELYRFPDGELVEPEVKS